MYRTRRGRQHKRYNSYQKFPYQPIDNDAQFYRYGLVPMTPWQKNDPEDPADKQKQPANSPFAPKSWNKGYANAIDAVKDKLDKAMTLYNNNNGEINDRAKKLVDQLGKLNDFLKKAGMKRTPTDTDTGTGKRRDYDSIPGPLVPVNTGGSQQVQPAKFTPTQNKLTGNMDGALPDNSKSHVTIENPDANKILPPAKEPKVTDLSSEDGDTPAKDKVDTDIMKRIHEADAKNQQQKVKVDIKPKSSNDSLSDGKKIKLKDHDDTQQKKPRTETKKTYEISNPYQTSIRLYSKDYSMQAAFVKHVIGAIDENKRRVKAQEITENQGLLNKGALESLLTEINNTSVKNSDFANSKQRSMFSDFAKHYGFIDFSPSSANMNNITDLSDKPIDANDKYKQKGFAIYSSDPYYANYGAIIFEGSTKTSRVNSEHGSLRNNNLDGTYPDFSKSLATIEGPSE